MKLTAKVIPKASSNQVTPLGKNQFKVRVTAAPAKGRANEVLIKVLADYFQVKKSQVEILKGETSRQKLIHIHGL